MNKTSSYPGPSKGCRPWPATDPSPPKQATTIEMNPRLTGKEKARREETATTASCVSSCLPAKILPFDTRSHPPAGTPRANCEAAHRLARRGRTANPSKRGHDGMEEAVGANESSRWAAAVKTCRASEYRVDHRRRRSSCPQLQLRRGLLHPTTSTSTTTTTTTSTTTTTMTTAATTGLQPLPKTPYASQASFRSPLDDERRTLTTTTAGTVATPRYRYSRANHRASCSRRKTRRRRSRRA